MDWCNWNLHILFLKQIRIMFLRNIVREYVWYVNYNLIAKLRTNIVCHGIIVYNIININIMNPFIKGVVFYGFLLQWMIPSIMISSFGGLLRNRLMENFGTTGIANETILSSDVLFSWHSVMFGIV